MPLLVNSLIFSMIPERAPFFLRPLLRTVFANVRSKMLDPRLKKHSELVSQGSQSIQMPDLLLLSYLDRGPLV